MTALSSPLLADLSARGFIRDCSDLSGLDERLCSGAPVAVYCGFDPTADSLHVGHMVSLTLLRRFHEAGCAVVPLIGRATAMVGDPSGRSTARPFADPATLDANALGVSESIRRTVGGTAAAATVSNDAWFSGMGWIEFLREVGARVPLGRMLALDSVRTRLDGGNGLSFLEFSYSLMQAYDFLTLSDRFPCLVQVGGSDQWGNICMGLELIGRCRPGRAAFALTHPLLTRSNGEKMGKSQGNAVWINPGRLPDFDFFRFWRTVEDADAVRLARLLSDRPLAEIEAAKGLSGAALEDFKEALAVELTARLRGEKAAAAALAASRGRGAVADGLPLAAVRGDEAEDIAAVLVRAGLAPSKSAARRLADQGGARVNGEKRQSIGLADYRGGVAVVSAGRTRHVAVRLSP